MVAYSFQKQFAEPILSGQKLQTIRAPRKRHARPGEMLQLYTGMRTRTCKKIAEKKCVAVIPVLLNFYQSGWVLVGESYPFDSPPSKLINYQTLPDVPQGKYKFADKEDFAWRDGFESFEDMSAFWAKHHDHIAETNYFIGLVIGWWAE